MGSKTDAAIYSGTNSYIHSLSDSTAAQILAPYAHVKDFIWCQEEPLNQGALRWSGSQHNFRDAIPTGATCYYYVSAGRPASASPAMLVIPLFIRSNKQLWLKMH